MTTKTKDWNDVTTDYVNNWTKTSTKIWQNWFDLMTKMPTVNPMEKTFPEWEKFNQMWLDNQELLTRFVKLSVQAWQDVFPEMELDSNWQEILTKYTKQMQTELTSFATSYQESNKNWSELWQFYLKQNEKLVSLWLEPLGLSKTTFNEFMMGKSSGLIELNNLYWNLLYDKGIGSFIKSPLLGPTREINAKILAGFDAWKDLYQASTNYQVLLAEIQVKSFEELIKELAARNEKGENLKIGKNFKLCGVKQ
jgi:class III poly(R)-hydroxyalkanoic acid synthase PhaE subunit